ncbi:MAG: barstar family protein [Saprospiraceae bacterium]|nr:barstar family protein [Saprospiraceae bacterium]
MKLQSEIVLVKNKESLQKINFEDKFLVWWDCSKASSWQELYLMISKSLKLPDYFGMNLDALYDGLLDLSWIPESEILIVLEHFDQILSEELITEPDVQSELLLLIKDVLTEWQYYTEDAQNLIPKKEILVCFIDCNKMEDILNQNCIEYQYI